MFCWRQRRAFFLNDPWKSYLFRCCWTDEQWIQGIRVVFYWSSRPSPGLWALLICISRVLGSCSGEPRAADWWNKSLSIYKALKLGSDDLSSQWLETGYDPNKGHSRFVKTSWGNTHILPGILKGVLWFPWGLLEITFFDSALKGFWTRETNNEVSEFTTKVFFSAFESNRRIKPAPSGPTHQNHNNTERILTVSSFHRDIVTENWLLFWLSWLLLSVQWLSHVITDTH